MKCIRQSLMAAALLSVAVLCPQVMWAQSSAPDADWASLSKHLGKPITVSSTDGQQHAGKLLRVEAERIVLHQNGSPTAIARSSVRRITRDHSRNKAAWIAGLSAAGFGIGAAIGFRAFDDATNSERKIGTAALAGAGAGAAFGYLISRGGRKQEVVYEAP